MAKRKRAKPVTAKPQDRAGAPYAIDDNQIPVVIDELRNLGRIMATTKECAAFFEISESTLFAFFDRVPAARIAYESAKDGLGKISLRRRQFALANKSATMAIFLGMNYLEQRDMRNVQQSGSVHHTLSLMGQMLKEIDEETRAQKMIDVTPNKQEAA